MDSAGQMPMACRSGDAVTAVTQHTHTEDKEDEFVAEDQVTETSLSDVSMGLDVEKRGHSISLLSQHIINHVAHTDTGTATSTGTTHCKNDLCYTPDETNAQHREKIVTIPVRKSKLELLRNDEMLTSLRRSYPDVTVTFEVENGYVGLTGADREVGAAKEAVETALSHYTSLYHVWPANVASALLQIPDAVECIRSACMDHDIDGIVLLTREGLEVCSDDEERAQSMMAAGVSAVWVRQWDITPDGEAGGAESSPEWQELKNEVQDRQRGRIVIMQDKTHLSIVGVGPVDEHVNLLQDFIEQRSYFDVKMETAEYELFLLFLDDPEMNGSTLPAVDITFNEDTSQLVVQGCQKYVQYAEKLIKRFQAKMIREQREFSQPSMREFLESHDWIYEHRPQIEKRVKCRILEPQAASSRHSESRQETGQCLKYRSMSKSAPDLRRLNTERDFKHHVLGPTPAESEEEGAVGDDFRSHCNIQEDDEINLTAEPASPPCGNLPHSRSDAAMPGPCARTTLSSDLPKYVPSNPRISLRPMSDVTEVEEDVLVNSTSPHLDLELGQISRALLKCGGSTLQQECRTNYPGGIKRGDIAVTGTGKPGTWGKIVGRKPLQCKKLFHCSLPLTKNVEEIKSAVRVAVTKCLEKMETLGLASIVFPALGTGNLNYPPGIVAQVMYEAVLNYGRQNPRTSVLTVVILLHRKAEDAHIREAFKAEDEKYQRLLRESLLSSQDETFPMSVVPSNAARVETYDNFTRTSSTVSVTILAYRQPAVEEAVQELINCYNKNVVNVSTNVPDLSFWNDPNIAAVKRMCAALKVDVTINPTLRQIEFRGLHNNYVNIARTMHETLNDAQQSLRQERDAAALSEQVQWSVMELITGDGVHLLHYDNLNNQRIETAYREGKLYATVKFDSDDSAKSYIVDVVTFEEKSCNIADAEPLRVIRQEKIEVLKADGELPAGHGWTAMNGQELDVIPLRADSKEYAAVVEGLPRAAVEITKIERVQNVTLHKQYMAMKRQMESSVASGCQRERDKLWHGTSLESVHNIITYGLHRSFCDTDVNNFGQGVYFTSSTESIKEDEFAVPTPSGERHAFRCKVLVGQYTKGDQRMRFPPEIPSTNPSRRYNSTVDDPKDPKVFVTYSHLQAYPEYHIVFKRK